MRVPSAGLTADQAVILINSITPQNSPASVFSLMVAFGVLRLSALCLFLVATSCKVDELTFEDSGPQLDAAADAVADSRDDNSSTDAASDALEDPIADGCMSVDICNGRDDDCDERIDENYVRRLCISEGGESGMTACDGEERCIVGGGGEPDADCDGSDDDGDGNVDEGFRAGATCEVEGEACDNGVMVCGPGGAECIATANEYCNGVDDDCNIAIDDGCCVPLFDNVVYCPRALSFEAASQRCAERGGQLLHIDSAELQERVVARLRAVSAPDVWINAIDERDGFQTTDGIALEYSNWREGEPNDVHPRCARLLPERYVWADRSCSLSFPFLCDEGGE